jgi:septal ring factor EnvC (AmiA/AmiB activator)
MKRVFGTTFLLSLFLFGIALAEDSNREAATARDDYERVIKEIQIQKKRHQDLGEKEKSLLDQLDQLTRKLNRKSKELRSLQGEISDTKKAISAQEDEMRGLNDQLAVTREQIQSRAAALYRISRVGPWAFLLSGENYSDFLRLSHFLYSMIDHDVRLFSEFENQLEQKKALQKKLETARNQLEAKRGKASLRKQEIQGLEQKKRAALEKTRDKRTSFAQMIRDLEKQAEKLESLVKSLSQRRDESSRRIIGFSAQRGRLPVPVAGKIERQGQDRHRGISLKARLGTTVRAVYRGRVVYADWFKGYGNLLIIDHGEKYHTVMGNASELLKEKDDWVETGEPVARVGSTGSFGGPSLYFEIRRAGVPVDDPIEWFSREDRLALK